MLPSTRGSRHTPFRVSQIHGFVAILFGTPVMTVRAESPPVYPSGYRANVDVSNGFYRPPRLLQCLRNTSDVVVHMRRDMELQDKIIKQVYRQNESYLKQLLKLGYYMR